MLEIHWRTKLEQASGSYRVYHRVGGHPPNVCLVQVIILQMERQTLYLTHLGTFEVCTVSGHTALVGLFWN